MCPPQVPMGPEDPAVVVASLRRNMEMLNALSTERAGACVCACV